MDSATIEAAKRKAEQAGFNEMEISAIGEVANITLGNAVTALSMLLRNDIDISTPLVEIKNKGEIVNELPEKTVVTRVDYVKGLDGYSVLFLKDEDVRIMTDLMMGSDGHGMFYDQEVSELHLSAVSESMNQMMGSAATAMGMMINKLVDISTPNTTQVDPGQYLNDAFPGEERFVQISFVLDMGKLIKTRMMQLYPFRLAKAIADLFIVKKNQNEGDSPF
ncbi:MAG: chemotaxis protein CheC [Lachnospiraceae bacterium]|nr:chemotaxis protein CheC [Lachnospiraceae bacterium]